MIPTDFTHLNILPPLALSMIVPNPSTNKDFATTPTFYKQNFSQMHHIDFINSLFTVPLLPFDPICTIQVWPGFETEK